MEISVHEIIQKAAENQRNQIPFVLATVVQGAEKTPGRTGFKMICYQNGKFEGTIGGGELERLALDKAQEVFKNQESQLLHYELTEDGIGMQCGGRATVFLEYIPTNKRVFLFGAGHLCRSMLPLLKSISFEVHVIDNRADFANKDRLPNADGIYATDYLTFLSDFHFSEQDAIIIFTHGHAHDFEILDEICKKNIQVKYIGMIGSKIKVKQAVDKIKINNYNGNLIEKIHAPIGLNIGKTTTQEIAIAIAAEILAVYNGVEKIDFLSKKS